MITLLVLAGATAGGFGIAAGLYLLSWDSPPVELLGVEAGTSWFEIIARGLGLLSISIGILAAGVLWYIASRVQAERRAVEEEAATSSASDNG